jgi:hypothetical protein
MRCGLNSRAYFCAYFSEGVDVVERVGIPAETSERLPLYERVLCSPIRDFGHAIACKRLGSGRLADGGVMM